MCLQKKIYPDCQRQHIRVWLMVLNHIAACWQRRLPDSWYFFSRLFPAKYPPSLAKKAYPNLTRDSKSPLGKVLPDSWYFPPSTFPAKYLPGLPETAYPSLARGWDPPSSRQIYPVLWLSLVARPAKDTRWRPYTRTLLIFNRCLVFVCVFDNSNAMS